MNLRRSLHTNKGYTLIELMITLFIFAIITMFGVPAFYDFIEQSRAKSQMVKAANFLRSAQEIATASNRIVYVYTMGYLNYNDTKKADYWYQDWVMSFKPIGHNYEKIDQIDAALRVGDLTSEILNPTYFISRSQVFTKSDRFHLSVLDSKDHNAVDRKKITGSTVDMEMEGYSRVRDEIQGTTDGKPTYIVFYPSGAIVMPVFVLDENDVDDSFSSTNQWDKIRPKFEGPMGILAGCRTGRGLTIDSISYTFSRSLLDSAVPIQSEELKRLGPSYTSKNNTDDGPYYAAPAFERFLCGSSFLQ